MKKMTLTAIAIGAVLLVSLATVAVIYGLPQALGYGQQGQSGQFAIMATDPPVTSDGVTAASITYTSVQVHSAGAAETTGWTQVSGSGTLDLMNSAAVSQTIAAAKVKAGTYDAVRFAVGSAKVTFQGNEYAATVTSSNITAQLQSQAHANASTTAAAVVDLRTIFMNTGNTTKPQFIFSATAFATAVPTSEAASVSLRVGATESLSGKAWFSQFVAQTSTKVHFVASLSSGSLLLAAQNSGSARAKVQEVIVTPVSGSAVANATLPASLSGSAVFAVDSTGSLQASNSLQAAALLTGGTTIGAGSAASLSFSGTISLDFGLGNVQLSGVVSGQEYLVTVVGANTFASTVVVAG